jgi:hypothetical protein
MRLWLCAKRARRTLARGVALEAVLIAALLLADLAVPDGTMSAVPSNSKGAAYHLRRPRPFAFILLATSLLEPFSALGMVAYGVGSGF